MDTSPLDIKLVRQQPDSDDCLRCCAKMVFSFFNDSITKGKLWKKLHVYRKHSGLDGGYYSDLGRLAIKRGYKVIIYHNSWHWWNEETAEASKKGKKPLLKALKNLIKDKKSWSDKKILRKEIECVKSGGKFKFEIPSQITIDSYLQKQIPITISVRGEDLYHNPKDNFRHAVVIVGKQGNIYQIKDPYLALDELNQEELIYAWARNGGWAIAIFPTKKIPKVKQNELGF